MADETASLERDDVRGSKTSGGDFIQQVVLVDESGENKADVDASGNISTEAGDLASAIEIIPTQIFPTTTDTGTPEALAADNTFFRAATIIGLKAARTPNVGTVYLGVGAANDTQPIPISPGQMIKIKTPSNGEKYDLNDLYLDVLNNNDGVAVIYS